MHGLFATNIDHLLSFSPFLKDYTKCFQLSDVLDYVKTGVAAIIEDEVSGNFDRFDRFSR